MDTEPLSGTLESPLLRACGFRHGFFTRRGGVSEPPWDSLNVAVSVGDTAAAVRENMALAATFLGVEADRLYVLSQVHGTDAIQVSGKEPAAAVAARKGDIVITLASGVACGIRTADCVPVLVGDQRTGAVVAIHSGWRGTVLGVVGAGVAALRAVAGRASDLVAAIGPHIERCCFEVGADVAQSLCACSSEGASAIASTSGKPRVDLRRIVRAQLVAAGVKTRSIEDVPGCTVCDRERFFSHRRDASQSGRMLSAIVGRVA